MKKSILFLAVLALTPCLNAGNGEPTMYRGWELIQDTKGYPPTSASPLYTVGSVASAAAAPWRRATKAIGGFVSSTNWLSTTAAADLPPASFGAEGWIEISVIPAVLGANGDTALRLTGGPTPRFQLVATTSTVSAIYTDDGAVNRSINLTGANKNDGSVHTYCMSWSNANTIVYAAVYRNGVLINSATNTANKINTGAVTAISVGAVSAGTAAWGGQIYYLSYGTGYRTSFPIDWYGAPPQIFNRALFSNPLR